MNLFDFIAFIIQALKIFLIYFEFKILINHKINFFYRFCIIETCWILFFLFVNHKSINQWKLIFTNFHFFLVYSLHKQRTPNTIMKFCCIIKFFFYLILKFWNHTLSHVCFILLIGWNDFPVLLFIYVKCKQIIEVCLIYL